MDPVVRLLADLVEIPSVNPMGRTVGGAGYYEEELARYVADYLRSNGVDVDVYDVAPHRPNVVGFIDAGAAETLMLEAHLDTVHADNMTGEPFRPLVREGRLYGRGACDTKGSLAAFLHAVCTSIKDHGKPACNILLVAVSDEEYRFTGALAAAARGLKADYGIAGEPTRLGIVRTHKGVTRFKIVVRGKAAHSAYPDRGDNAIYTMAQILLRLEDHALALMEEKPHPVLGTPTLSVGVIEGGQAVNIVPDRCWIEVDRRTLPGETSESVLASMRAALREVPGWTLEGPHLAIGGMEVPPDAPIVRLLSAAIVDVTGDVRVEAAHYATDAGVYNAAGIPTVVFGPGDIAQAHTESEYIELEQLTQAVRIMKRILG